VPELFGEKLRALRHQHNLTQVLLAQSVGLSRNVHVSKLEAMQDPPSLALVVRMARFFGVSTDYLLRDTIPVYPLPASTVALPTVEATELAVGARLRELRLERHLRQIEVSQRLGLARQGYVSNLETGKKLPSLDLVLRLADLFEVSTDALLLTAPRPTAEGQSPDPVS
jgi:transcriptional regulator with XRE-family HTH domain